MYSFGFLCAAKLFGVGLLLELVWLLFVGFWVRTLVAVVVLFWWFGFVVCYCRLGVWFVIVCVDGVETLLVWCLWFVVMGCCGCVVWCCVCLVWYLYFCMIL